MGNCASCVGRQKDVYEEESESRLLIENGSNVGYGSFGENQLGAQSNPEEAQIETEALQRVVAQTSNNMIDVFEIVPRGDAGRTTPAQYGFSGQDSRASRYQQLLSRLSEEEDGPMATTVHADWVSREEDEEGEEDEDVGVDYEKQRKAPPTLKFDDDGPLVGTFSDAGAAMR